VGYFQYCHDGDCYYHLWLTKIGGACVDGSNFLRGWARVDQNQCRDGWGLVWSLRGWVGTGLKSHPPCTPLLTGIVVDTSLPRRFSWLTFNWTVLKVGASRADQVCRRWRPCISTSVTFPSQDIVSVAAATAARVSGNRQFVKTMLCWLLMLCLHPMYTVPQDPQHI